MSNTVFYKNNNGELISLNETLYENEDYLQELIEKNHCLLGGDIINPEKPRKWILVAREMGVPDEADGSNIWSLDHLFLDQDGIPTLVEVKRSTDTRIRREVVGQMLDYAANGSLYWNVKDLQKAYSGDICVELGLSEEQANDYWNSVDNNLKLGKLRLIFAADKIPESLQRIIEFLNNQMQNTEVLGLEIKQFISSDGKQLFIPNIIGKTLLASETKNKRVTKEWTKETFLNDVAVVSGEEIKQLSERLISDIEKLGCRVWYGSGASHGSIVAIYDKNSKTKCHLFSFYVWTTGSFMELYFQHYKPPYDTFESKMELKKIFEEILDIEIPNNRLNGRPSFKPSILLDEKKYDRFISLIEEMVCNFKKH